MPEQKVMTHVTKGLIASLVLILVGVVGHVANFDVQSWFRWIPLLILFAAIVWACISYSNQMNAQVSFGNLFVHGFKMAAVVTVITILWSVISISLIFPDSKEQAMEIAKQNMVDKGTMSDAQIEQGIDIARRFFYVFVIGFIMLSTLIVGAIASLVGAAVAKKSDVNPFEQLDQTIR